MKIKLIIPFICVFLIIGCQPRNSSKNRLKQRVGIYYEYLIKGELGLTWDLLWHDAKRKRNRNEWTLFLKEAALERKLIEFHLKSISTYKFGKRILGKVKLFGKHMIINQNKIENIEGEDKWVFENGDWFRFLE